MITKNKSLFAELGLLLITVIWGSAFVVVKNAAGTVPVNYIIAIRFGIATILLLIVFFPRLKKMNLRTVQSGAVLGTLLYLAYYFQTIGVKYTTAGNNAFLTAIYVVVVPFLYWFIKKKKPGGYNIIAALICIVGIGFLSLQSDFKINIGDSLTLLCGIIFAAQIVGISILTEKIDPILLSLTQLGFTGIIAIVAALFTEQLPSQLGMDSIWALLYLGVFSTMIAMVMQTVCQKYVAPAKASLIMSLESLFGTLSGILFLSEKLTVKTVIGFILIFFAILISETKLSFLNRNNPQKAKEGNIQ